jgi:ribonuclease HI
MKKQVTIYTDGACHGNPGPGGYGVVLLYGGRRRELSGGFRLTTNNRMELLAAITGLETLKEPCQVTLHSDSLYVVKAMQEGWPARWRANAWRRQDKQPAVNPDLWQRLLDLCETHDVSFEWVRGHASNIENERCDELANDAARRPGLPQDEGYELAGNSSRVAPDRLGK